MKLNFENREVINTKLLDEKDKRLVEKLVLRVFNS